MLKLLEKRKEKNLYKPKVKFAIDVRKEWAKIWKPKRKSVNKLVIYLKPAKDFDDISKKAGLQMVIQALKEVLEAHGWKFKIVHNNRFEIESEDWE